MVQFAITAPQVAVNNQVIYIVPNSLVYTEGLGAQEVRPQSGGGGAIENVVIDNVDGKKSSIKFSIENTVTNIDLARSWKLNTGKNGITITDLVTGFSRTFQGVVLINNYEVGLGADKNLALEFEGSQAV